MHQVVGLSKVTTNGGTYTVYVPASGSYYLACYYDPNNLVSITGNYSPLLLTGVIYDAIAGGIPVAGPTSYGSTIVFGSNNQWPGFYGTVTYTGSYGAVGTCRQIYVYAYSDSAYSSQVAYGWVSSNGGTYSVYTAVNGSQPGISPIYVRAYFDAVGGIGISTGDPYVNLGPLTGSKSGVVHNITFGDTNVW